jgi:hypothetical protein
MFSQAACTSGSAHVTSQPPSSRSFLLHTSPSLLVFSTLRLRALARQQALNFTSSNDSLTHYSSAITHHLSLHHHLPLPRQEYHRSLILIAGASTTPRRRHAAQSGTTSTSLLLSLIGGTRKTQRLARQRAVGSMITNLLLQTTRVVRFASLCELLNATSTQASKILIIMLLQPE